MKKSKGRFLGLATFAILTLLLNVDVYADVAFPKFDFGYSKTGALIEIISFIIVVCIIVALILRYLRNNRNKRH